MIDITFPASVSSQNFFFVHVTWSRIFLNIWCQGNCEYDAFSNRNQTPSSNIWMLQSGQDLQTDTLPVWMNNCSSVWVIIFKQYSNFIWIFNSTWHCFATQSNNHKMLFFMVWCVQHEVIKTIGHTHLIKNYSSSVWDDI